MSIVLASRLFVTSVICIVGVGLSAGLLAAEGGASSELTLALSQAELFRDLTDDERTALESVATLLSGNEGERIIEEGKPLDRMFIVMEGQVEVKVGGVLVATLSPQALVGEVEFLDLQPASADVFVMGNTRLIALDNAGLNALMVQQPRLGYVLMREIGTILAQRLRAMNESVTPESSASGANLYQ